MEIYGRKGTIVAATKGSPQRDASELVGAQGNAKLAPLPVPERYLEMPAATPVGPPRNVGHLYQRMERAIRDGTPPEPGFDVAVARHRLIDAIVRSPKKDARFGYAKLRRMPVPSLRVAARDACLPVAFALACAASPAHAQWYVPEAVFGAAGYNSGADVALAGVGASWDLSKRSNARDETGFMGPGSTGRSRTGAASARRRTTTTCGTSVRSRCCATRSTGRRRRASTSKAA